MIEGRCLCGDVQYRYEGNITEVAICHCRQCRQAQGTPFVTNAPIELEKLTFCSGADVLKSYFSSELKRRVFCSNCGSPIFSQRTDVPEVVRLRLGTVTTPLNHSPDYHIFHDYKSEWFDVAAEIPSYPENKPG